MSKASWWGEAQEPPISLVALLLTDFPTRGEGSDEGKVVRDTEPTHRYEPTGTSRDRSPLWGVQLAERIGAGTAGRSYVSQLFADGGDEVRTLAPTWQPESHASSSCWRSPPTR